MSVSLSIFEKLCPSCATAITASAERCPCGHVFDSASSNAQETALRDEELYENYLAARAAQAQEAAHAALAAHAEHPDDADRLAAAELAQEVAMSIDADLGQQRTKVTALRTALEKSQPQAPVATTPVTLVTPQTAEVAKPVSVRPKSTANPKPAYRNSKPKTHKAPVVIAKTVAVQKPSAKPESTVTAERAVVVEPPVPQVNNSLTPLSSATRAASVLETIKIAKAREEAARIPTPVVSHNQKSETSLSTAPPATFRAEQAARAEQALAAHKTVEAKECPNCTASVPTNTTRCRCGYAFVSCKDDLPSLTLCTGDFTALRDSLNLNLRRN